VQGRGAENQGLNTMGSGRSAGVCVFCSALGETHTKSAGFKDLYKRIEGYFPQRDKIDAKRDGPGSRGFASLSSASWWREGGTQLLTGRGVVFAGISAVCALCRHRLDEAALVSAHARWRRAEALDKSSGMSLLVLGNPTKPLSASECQRLVQFVLEGGHLLATAAEGGFQDCNLNSVLQQFGVAVNSDAVVRSVYHKYLHPKHVFISDGVVNRAVADTISARSGAP